MVRRHRGRAEHDWLLESDYSLAEGKHVPSDRRTVLRSCQLLIPWRFFRLWALAGGIDPPENMVRCMVNNYSALGFWRSWHRSYNLWIVRYANLVQRRICQLNFATRYIYIPLGGTKNAVFTTVLVFSFVALWHDLSFRLLAWGWLVSLFIFPELLASYLLPAKKVRHS